MKMEPPPVIIGSKEKKDMTKAKSRKKSKTASFMMCFVSPADDCFPEKSFHRRVVGGSGNSTAPHKKGRKNIIHHDERLDVAIIDEFEKKKMNYGEMPRVLDAVLLANSLESMENSIKKNKMRISSYRKMLPFEERLISSNSCSSTSSSSSNSRSNSFDGREANFFSQGINYHGLWLVLIMLSVLMLWGKLCAILCTSIWLCFVPRRCRHRILGRLKTTAVNHDQFVSMVDQVDYKRRVVLEGFLERNNRPTLL